MKIIKSLYVVYLVYIYSFTKFNKVVSPVHEALADAGSGEGQLYFGVPL